MTLKMWGSVDNIVCHSFTDRPLNTDQDKVLPSHDICIGTAENHATSDLLDFFKNQFENLGYSVKLNSPYSGTMIPAKFYKKGMRVGGLMIENNLAASMSDWLALSDFLAIGVFGIMICSSVAEGNCCVDLGVEYVEKSAETGFFRSCFEK